MPSMSKLIVTADLHGSYSSWLTIKHLLNSSDFLAVAGDLFDTKYGNYSHTDFSPESIKKELSTFEPPFYYVYGNCDTPAFFPGFDSTMTFSLFNKKIHLSHGHQAFPRPEDADIIIQGHTHLCSLEKKDRQLLMNPGSISCPRNSLFTYGIIDRTSARLVDLKTGIKISKINF